MKKISQKDLENLGFEEYIEIIGSVEVEETIESRAFGLPIPRPYKVRYDMIQSRTTKTFGKVLRKIIMDAIDRTSAKLGIDEAAS